MVLVFSVLSLTQPSPLERALTSERLISFLYAPLSFGEVPGVRRFNF